MRNLFTNRDGATAIEFALLAMPFTFLLMGVIELCLMFAADSLFEGATTSAARLIRTGQLQQGYATASEQENAFRDALCTYATALIDCNGVILEAQKLTNFSDAESSPPTYDTTTGELVPTGFAIGGSDDKVLVRVFYRYHFMTPLIGPLLGGADSAVDFVSTVVLETEPYEFEH